MFYRLQPYRPTHVLPAEIRRRKQPRRACWVWSRYVQRLILLRSSATLLRQRLFRERLWSENAAEIQPVLASDRLEVTRTAARSGAAKRGYCLQALLPSSEFARIGSPAPDESMALRQRLPPAQFLFLP